MRATHGTQLRHLLELLDGAVSGAYEAEGLSYRPRYTPIVRALMKREPATIGQIAESAGITQPAATQTIALMIKEGLLAAEPGPDARQKMIQLTPLGREILPRIQQCWEATAQASADLEAELPFSLTEVLASTIEALARKPFDQRIREARTAMADKKK